MRETVDLQYNEEHHARKRARYEVASTQSTQSSNDEENEELPTGTNGRHQPESSVTCTISDRVPAKNEEIRRAHRYLLEHADPELLQIGPLPLSVQPNGEADSFNTIESSEHEVTIPRQPTYTDFNNDGANSPLPNNQSPSQIQESQHTDSFTLPISESALAPSSPIDADAALLAEEFPSDRGEPSSETGSGLRASAGRQRIMSRLRTRISAYLAAQEGSYSAWEDHSLVSAGSNHTEAEKEL